MPKRSRRRLLVGVAAALSASVAGCGDRTVQEEPDGEYETLTPAEVPREPEDVFAEIVETSIPTVPAPDPVEEAHVAAATAQLEAIVEEAEAAMETIESVDVVELARSDADAEGATGAAIPDDPGGAVADARDSISALRDRDASHGTLVQCRRVIERAAGAAGYLGAVAGTLDVAAVFEERREIVDTLETFAAGTEYRLTEPYGDGLLAVSRAEETLSEAIDFVDEHADLDEEALSADDASLEGSRRRVQVAKLRSHLAVLRRLYDDADRLRAVGTSPDAPPREAAIDELLAALLSEAESLALDPDETSDGLSELNQSPTDDVRRVRLTTGRRGTSTIERAERRDAAGEPVRALLTITEWIVNFDSIDTAAESVLEGDGDVDPEDLLGAKREAAEAMEELSSSGGTSRYFGRIATSAIHSADEAIEPPGSGRLFAYFAYRAGERIAAESVDRASEIAASIEAQQS